MRAAAHSAKKLISRILVTLVVVVLLGVFGLSLYSYLNRESAFTEINAIRAEIGTSASVDFAALKAQNPDTVAWLKVPGTDIDYPVVQTTDNEFYLTRDFNKQPNIAGWIFADFRSDLEALKSNTILYGHGMENGLMFGTLNRVLQPEWIAKAEQQLITVETESAVMTWQVFSGYTIPTTTDYLGVSFNNGDETSRFIDLITKRSAHTFNVPVTATDKILTLSTCGSETTRTVVHAKLVSTVTK